MNVFGALFGGVLKSVGAEDVLKSVGTHATAAVARGPISELFQKMHAEARGHLADQLEKAAGALRDGRCNDAADVAADVIGGIKF